MVAEASLLTGLGAWLPFAGFWLLLACVTVAELVRPLHLRPAEGKGRLAANFGLGLINACLFLLLPLSAVFAAQWAGARGLGLFNAFAVPALVAVPLTVAVWSLANYLLHRLFHGLPWLWRLHRVHHADTAIDLSTGFRSHPGEALLLAVARAAVAIAFGLSVPALIIAETLAIAFTMWSHANLRLPDRLDRSLRLLLVTPAMHHVHHSARRAETDSNYGDVFSLWDRLFGTYRRSDIHSLRTLRFGLGAEHDEGSSNLLRQLAAPLAR